MSDYLIQGQLTNSTTEGSAEDALRKGLDDLIDLCDVVADKFTAAREEHASRMEA